MARREAPSEGRESIISVRLSPREEEQIKKAAKKRGEPVSAFVRGAALEVARPATVGSSWSTSQATRAARATVVPRYNGTVVASRPAPESATAGAAEEPISHAR